MYICIYVYMYICIYVYMYICIYVYMYICIYVYMYICIYVYMYICIYVYMYICIYVYMYICIYVYMYILYVYMYICIYENGTEDHRRSRRRRKNKEKKTTAEARDEDLRAVLNKRKAPEPTGSALKLKGDDLKKTKKKKKRKRVSDKNRQSKKEKASEGSSGETDSGDEESSSSTSGSLFQLAALPQGVDRLHRLHQEKPGALADLTLRRFQELLNRSIGGGSAEQEQEMHPVARAYLSQIYMARSGHRVAEPERAPHVGHLGGPDGDERFTADEEHRAVRNGARRTSWNSSCPRRSRELGSGRSWKAAQQEHKSDLRLKRDQWPRRRTPWYPTGGGAVGADKKETDGKEGGPPENGGGQSQGKGKKGRGKGKKGKRW